MFCLWCFNPALVFAPLAKEARCVVVTSGTLSTPPPPVQLSHLELVGRCFVLTKYLNPIIFIVIAPQPRP
jgi:hypothetical protein